jgi:hypothetical protein
MYDNKYFVYFYIYIRWYKFFSELVKILRSIEFKIDFVILVQLFVRAMNL